MVNGFNEKVDFIWSIADLLRGDYKQSEYQKVILPLTVLRRLDCVTEPTKDEVLERAEELEDQGIENAGPMLKQASGQNVYNTSEYTFESLCKDADHIAENFQYYINSFDEDTKEILDKFDFDHQIQRLDEADLLLQVVQQFREIDLHPDEVPNEEMGYIYEELIRKFSELSNETAGEHSTPREVIELMVNLIFDEDDEALRQGLRSFKARKTVAALKQIAYLGNSSMVSLSRSIHGIRMLFFHQKWQQDSIYDHIFV